ncbi:hypothetical protein [uncultured Kordia sp.]|uniref:hypothetical protein n=1 Tax=uncultured Kordia sp. TaxID=507699 RepID=UPI002638CE9E|nr:hypothetical protein [uncultured Kordia sp.]
MKKSFLICLIMVSFLVGCTSKSTDKVSSTINFEKGFTQTLVFGTNTSASKMGFFEDKNEVQFRLDEITSDSSFVFTGKVTRMQYKSDMFGEKENVDTEIVKALNNTNKMSATELEVYNDIKQYLDKEYTFTLDKYGTMIKSAEFKDQSLFLDASIIKGFSIVPTMSFPKEDLAVGVTWDYNTTNPLMESQKIKFSYTVDDITNDKIFIDVQMEMDGIGGVLSKNKAEGRYEIDRKTKRFIKGSRTMKMQTGGGKATYSITEK